MTPRLILSEALSIASTLVLLTALVLQALGHWQATILALWLAVVGLECSALTGRTR